MLTIENLSVSYSKDKQVLSNLNCSFSEQSIHGLVGLNGSGKTTLLHTIYGIINQDNGTILFNSEKLSKNQIAFLETDNYFYSNITGKEYLSLFKNDGFEIHQWNQLFDLPLNTIIDNYSTGMKRKLAIMGVLILNRPIIILDEPFNGLDLESSKTLQNILLRLKTNGKTVIITSHILESLTTICNEIHYLENGKIKFSKAKSNFKTLEYDIFQAFNKNEIIDNLLKK